MDIDNDEERFDYRNITETYYKTYLRRKEKCRAIHRRLQTQSLTIADWNRTIEDDLDYWSEMLLFGIVPDKKSVNKVTHYGNEAATWEDY